MRAGLAIVDLEARRNDKGFPILYKLPANDGGGAYEIAGINSRYHPEALDRIRALPASQREQSAALYIEEYTTKGTGIMIPTYIFGALFLLCVVVAVYKVIRRAKRNREWRDEFTDGW
jgi:hypothetical protein